jgi:hypothetical protein
VCYQISLQSTCPKKIFLNIDLNLSSCTIKDVPYLPLIQGQTIRKSLVFAKTHERKIKINCGGGTFAAPNSEYGLPSSQNINFAPEIQYSNFSLPK